MVNVSEDQIYMSMKHTHTKQLIPFPKFWQDLKIPGGAGQGRREEGREDKRKGGRDSRSN